MINIALTNLGKYNEGQLIFEWLALPATEEEISDVLDKIGINERYEEYFITDFDTDIEGLSIGEYDSLEALNTMAEEYEDLAEYDQEVVAAIVEAEGFDLQRAIDCHRKGDYSFYPRMDLEDVAKAMVDEGLFGNVDRRLKNYIDYAAIARDLRIDNHTETSKGVVCIH